MKDVPEERVHPRNLGEGTWQGRTWCRAGRAPPGRTMDRSSSEIGGVLALKSDFDVLDGCLEGWKGSEEEKALIGEVREKF